jgi:NAD(P)-dependent dehydrogenase (short-subunit alcohol dehydrogenase family)
MANNVLLVGGSGGIANAVINGLIASQTYDHIYVVSRRETPNKDLNDRPEINWIQLDSSVEDDVVALIESWRTQDIEFTRFISTVGVLHSDSLKPEKRLEDINTDSLMSYFHTNVGSNAVWLKHANKFMSKSQSEFVVLSARVGSISDNRLGGWYGYRASKAALNMLLKTASPEFKRRLPNCTLVCYHPGTVDTELSKPFQANVKPEKLFTADFTAQQLLSILNNLNRDSNIHYLDWQGVSIPW